MLNYRNLISLILISLILSLFLYLSGNSLLTFSFQSLFSKNIIYLLILYYIYGYIKQQLIKYRFEKKVDYYLYILKQIFALVLSYAATLITIAIILHTFSIPIDLQLLIRHLLILIVNVFALSILMLASGVNIRYKYFFRVLLIVLYVVIIYIQKIDNVISLNYSIGFELCIVFLLVLSLLKLGFRFKLVLDIKSSLFCISLILLMLWYVASPLIYNDGIEAYDQIFKYVFRENNTLSIFNTHQNNTYMAIIFIFMTNLLWFVLIKNKKIDEYLYSLVTYRMAIQDYLKKVLISNLYIYTFIVTIITIIILVVEYLISNKVLIDNYLECLIYLLKYATYMYLITFIYDVLALSKYQTRAVFVILLINSILIYCDIFYKTEIILESSTYLNNLYSIMLMYVCIIIIYFVFIKIYKKGEIE